MKKNLVFAILALFSTLGVGLALQGRFSDIPRDFWAEGAVNRMVAEGIVSGYPDATFRGANNVNRYEVTSMFDRLFLSRRFITLETSARATSTELGNLRGADAALSDGVNALRADVDALKTSNNQTLNINDRFDNLEKQANEQREVVNQLKAELEAQKTQSSTVARLSEQNTALNARVAQLEQQASENSNSAETIAALQTQLAGQNTRLAQLEQRSAPQADSSALNARVVALEAQAARIPALEAQAAKVAALETQVAKIPALENQVARIPALETQVAKIPALEAQIGSLNTSVASLQRALSERPSTPVPTAPSSSPSTAVAPTLPDVSAPTPTPPVVVQQDPTPSVVAPRVAPPLSVALGISSNLLPNGNYNAPLGVGVLTQVGLNLSENFGVRFGLDLSEIPSFGVNAILGLGNGFYAGVGGGLVFAGGGVYLGGIIGFSFDLAQNFALFLEANPRLNFATGFGIKTALGVRFGL